MYYTFDNPEKNIIYIMYHVFEFCMYLKSIYGVVLTNLYEFFNIVFNRTRNRSLQCRDVEILKQSDDFLIINKPYDMVINSNDPKVQESIQSSIRRKLPYLVNPDLHHEFYFVHRLDYATSGVMCLALNKKSAKAASTAFEKRTVEKYYLAFVHGHIIKPSLFINVPIGYDMQEMNQSRKMCTSEDFSCIKPRKSCTALLVLERGYKNGKAVTKILLFPKTGRRHQLRVHCTYIGHTIVGDYTYSGKTDIEPYRTFLHALRLVIDNTIETIDVQTCDPFTSIAIENQWNPTDVVRLLDTSAFYDIHKLASHT